jgi:hypothetical protein
MLKATGLNTTFAGSQADRIDGSPSERREAINRETTFITFVLSLEHGAELLECTLHYRVERWTEEYIVGELLHSVTLLPGSQAFITASSGRQFARFVEGGTVSQPGVSRSSDRFWMEVFESQAQDFDVAETGYGLFSDSELKAGIRKNGGQGTRTSGSLENGRRQSSGSSAHHLLTPGNLLRRLSRHFLVTIKRTSSLICDQASVTIAQVSGHGEAVSALDENLKISTRIFKNSSHRHALSLYFYPIYERQRVEINLVEKRLRLTGTERQQAGNGSSDWTNGSTPLYTSAGRYVNGSRLAALLPDPGPVETPCTIPTELVHVQRKLQLISG